MSADAHRGATAEPWLRRDVVGLTGAVRVLGTGHAATQTAALVRS
jgi:hypothetical protein